MPQNKKPLPWHIIEKQILKEMNWLRVTIDTPPFSKSDPCVPIKCPECLLRKIAILIINGKVKAKEIKKTSLLKSFWAGKSRNSNQKRKSNKIHGSAWHNATMEKIENHFLCQNFEVEREPNLYWGRADLGIYKNGEKDLHIEVGTISLFKLLINLKMMKNCIYLIVPDDKKLIEFTCN